MGKKHMSPTTRVSSYLNSTEWSFFSPALDRRRTHPLLDRGSLSFQGKLLLPAAAAQPPLRQTPKRDFSIAVANETLRLCRNGLLAACHLLPPPLSLSRCFPRPLLLNNTTKTSRHQ
ncbi:hypothetical protein CGMCC3_g4479 [Colletotrichum fructicola]|nr:uncharacterized protein CGMCC3_g4479 [Colletotrichum fructicola]KAE9579541.1 hypothetical protein CGMCC3_g4479 [Colletotrichum fructicola]